MSQVIYNVTVKIDLDAHDDWLHWMKNAHIPDVMATGLFTESRMLRIMAEDESDGISYAIQYDAKSMSDYLTYQAEQAPRLQKDHQDKFANKYVAYRTLMRLV